MGNHISISLFGFDCSDLCSPKECLQAYREFQIGTNDCQISFVSFLHYCDVHGDAWFDGEEPHHKIAKRFYESFSNDEKKAVASYFAAISEE